MAKPSVIAILSPGDMGSGVGRALAEHGFDIITALNGRSPRSRQLAEAANFRDVGNLDEIVSQADLILSILPPASALAQAEAVAAAMQKTGQKPDYADCNAISPATAAAVGGPILAVGANYIDGGIIGLAPGKGPATRFYVSGSTLASIEALDGAGIQVKSIGAEIGRASGLKMCYAGLTKGQFTLFTAVLVAAEALGLSEPLRDELEFSQAQVYGRMQGLVPRLPADAGRWIGEMEEIAQTFADAGVTADFHNAAAEIFRLLDKTPFAAETRETLDTSRTLEQSVRVYRDYLDKP
jgi:3-hydroxyisobutyrate dehydrogenase-like beta-hydroxyacid dehydrogenase